MIPCTYEPGIYPAKDFRVWSGWTFHVEAGQPLHDVTGVVFQWNAQAGEPEPLPIQMTVSGGGGGGGGMRPDAEAALDVEESGSYWHSPTPAEREQPDISDEDRALLEEADLAELEQLAAQE